MISSPSSSIIIESLIQFSLENLSSKEKNVRKTLLVILTHSLNVLDEISDRILLSYREIVSKHLYDREWMVRVEAINGMSRLQSLPLNPLDDDRRDKVMSVGDALMEISSNDPNPECRKIALLQMEVSGEEEISLILQRRRDTSPLVRRALFTKKISSSSSSSSGDFISLKPGLIAIKHYDSLFRDGLSDHDPSVKQAVRSCLFGSFISEIAEGNLIKLLLSFDSLINRSLCEMTLISFYSLAEQDGSKNLFTEFPLLYLENLTPETALAMRVYLQFRMNLFSIENSKPIDWKNVSPSAATSNRTISPTDLLPPLKEIVDVLTDLQRRLIGLSSEKDEERMEIEFCISELLRVILLLGDDIDEVGYRSLEHLVLVDILPNLGIKEEIFDISLKTLKLSFIEGGEGEGEGMSSPFYIFLNQCLPLIEDFTDLFKPSTTLSSMESLIISDNSGDSNDNNNESKATIKMSWRVAAQVRSLKLINRSIDIIPLNGIISEIDQILISDLLEQHIIPSINSDYSSVQLEGMKVLCNCSIRLGRRDFIGGNNLIREYLVLMKEFVQHANDPSGGGSGGGGGDYSLLIEEGDIAGIALQCLFDSCLIDPMLYLEDTNGIRNILKGNISSIIAVEGFCKILLTKRQIFQETSSSPLFSDILLLVLKEFIILNDYKGRIVSNNKSQQILTSFFSRFICSPNNRLFLAQVIPDLSPHVDDLTSIDVLIDLMNLDYNATTELAFASLWSLLGAFKRFHSKNPFTTRLQEQRELSFLSVLSIKAVMKCKSSDPSTLLARKELLLLLEQCQRILNSLFYSSVKKIIFNQFNRAITSFGIDGDVDGDGEGDGEGGNQRLEVSLKIQKVLGNDLLRDFKKLNINL